MTLNWPSGVTDQTPLPYSLWRVLDALALGLTSGQGGLPSDSKVQEALALAEQYAGRAQRQEQALSGELIDQVSAALMACVGPIGQIIIEDALDELPEPARLSALLRAIGAELEDTQRQMFGSQLRTRGIV
ncbi:hypothetical protein FNU79_05365 [Deinococcus detaillensis]|uniref:DUF8082 domain-containing protein n=1 Tax=Deinococcus detaillensis TaxID=2592048 RepID=A0A553V4D9_9DEIO|nr:hypothetical protein [Deinococcus detaillensis]TSA87312.1 hypothetical protein FNU79_05365 [Deinococcus detaillensis]